MLRCQQCMHAEGACLSRYLLCCQVVAAPRGGCAVVLQMPRGNLEAVQPRALVLAAVTAALLASACIPGGACLRRRGTRKNTKKNTT